MALRVVCFSTYRTSIAGGWRGIDYDAHDFIDAIKDRDISGYSNVPLRGKWHRFDNTNRQDVIGWFAAMVPDYFTANPVDGLIVLVPVPGSKIDVRSAGTPRTAQLAEAIAAAMDAPVAVADVLRQKAPIPSANEEGGTRDEAELLENLVLMDAVKELPVVLVDDVLTSGGHLKACAAMLREAGADVLMAVVAGRADGAQVPDPFAIRTEDIPDYER
jgi:predicted amidophosphoribosyltransferase